MLQTKIRPLTVTERERLEAELIESTTDRKPDYISLIATGGVGAFFGVIGSGFLAGFLSIWELPGFWAVVIVGAGAVAGFALGYRNALKSLAEENKWRKEHAATLATRLGRGEIQETTVTASAVAHVTDGDEVDGYFFDIGDNRVVFLWSMDMWDDASDETPLSTAFTFTHFDDDSVSIYAFVEMGEPLAPVRELAFTGDDWRDTYQTGAVFENVSLATLETDLPYLTLAPDEPEG